MLVSKKRYLDESPEFFIEFSEVYYSTDKDSFKVEITVGLQVSDEESRFPHPLFFSTDIELAGSVTYGSYDWSNDDRIVETEGKTARFVTRSLWVEEKNPDAIIPAATAEAKKIQRAIRGIIEDNLDRAKKIPEWSNNLYTHEAA